MKNPFEKLERKYEKMRRQRDEARAELLKLRTIQVTIEPSARNITMPSDNFFKIEKFSKFLQAPILKEMHIDCEKKDFEVGKWYKNRIDSVRSRFTEKGSLNSGYQFDYWLDDTSMTDFSLWEEMTPKEIELLLIRRCKELGLFDGEFKCLSGLNFSNHKEGLIQYWEEDDKLWIGKNIAYKKGKFAKLVKKKN